MPTTYSNCDVNKLIIEQITCKNYRQQQQYYGSARYSYENCVFNSAWSKCNGKSAKFTRKVVELLSSERQFKNCAKIEKSLCSNASRSYNALKTIVHLLYSAFFLSGVLVIRQL